MGGINNRPNLIKIDSGLQIVERSWLVFSYGSVEISWQGLSIHRKGSSTEIIFPDGKTYQSESEQPVLVSSDSSGRERERITKR